MKIAEIRFLEQEEPLPKWTKFMTEKMRENYVLSKRPFSIAEEGDQMLVGTLAQVAGQGLSAPWREKAEELLEELERQDVGIVIAPYTGEFPRKRLPFAKGAVLTPLFAFAGAAEALRRQGKRPEEATFILAGNDAGVLSLVLAGMEDYVNKLAFFTDDTASVGEIAENLYEERGLSAEVFSSPKHPLFSQGDVVIVCGMEQTGYEHILKRNAVFIDAAGNRPVLRKLCQRRWDVGAADGFYFLLEGKQEEGRKAEALLYRKDEAFRGFWQEAYEEEFMEACFRALKEEISVSGFSRLGKRVKIEKI